MISEEAVEAAAMAHFENGWGDSRKWEDAEVEAQSEARNDMRAALEAAAPHLLAQAWQEGNDIGYNEAECHGDGDGPSRNPYRPTP